MGLFKKKKRIVTVGASSSNLAGPPVSRGNYLTNTVLYAVFSDAPSIGGSISSAYANSPANRLRRLDSWAKRSGYNDYIGNLPGQLLAYPEITQAIFDEAFPAPVGRERELQDTTYGVYDYDLFAWQYLRENDPAKLDTDYVAGPYVIRNSYTDTVTSTNEIEITFEDATKIHFLPDVPSTYQEYIYFRYGERDKVFPTHTEEPVTTYEDIDDLPSISGYAGEYTLPLTEEVSLASSTKVSITYSDSTPPSESLTEATTTEEFDTKTGTFTKQIDDYQLLPVLIDRAVTLIINHTYKIVENTVENTDTETLPDGVIKTTVTTVTTEAIVPIFTAQFIYDDLTYSLYDDTQLLIYGIGSDPAIDALVGTTSIPLPVFLPFITARNNNMPVNKDTAPEWYQKNRNACRRAFGSVSSYSKILKNIEKNPNKAEMDYVHLRFGNAFGSKEQEAIQANFALIEEIIQLYNCPSTRPTLEDIITEYDDRTEEWLQSSTQGSIIRRFLAPAISFSESFVLRLAASNNRSLQIQISFDGGQEITGTGYHAKSANKINNCWAYKHREVSGVHVAATPVIRVGKQVSDSSWVEYEIYHFQHTQTIFEGHGVTITGEAALAAEKPEEVGFILPMTIHTLEALRPVPRAQAAMGAAYITTSYYDVRVIKVWRGWVKVALVVVSIVIAVATGYIDFNTVGVFGTAGSVGTAVGLSGTAAIMAGAIVNAAAASVITGLVMRVATKVFGAKLGQILGTIASFLVMNFAQGGTKITMDGMIREFTKADNLIKWSQQAMGVYSQSLQQKAIGVMQDAQKVMADYHTQSAALQRRYDEFFRPNGLDPQLLAQLLSNASETREEFLARTLITGTDIARMTLSIITDFPKHELSMV